MAISPVNITRISQNLRTNLIVDSVRRNQLELFLTQTRIATGRRFVSPSEDPVGASRALDLTQALARQEQFVANVQYGDNFLTAADSALTELNSLLIQASSIASQTVSNLTSADERAAEAEVITAIRQQVQTVGNRQFDGRYIFAGRDTLDRPFVDGLGGVVYTGDIGELVTRVSDDLLSPISMPGSQVFGALSAPIASNVDLTPTLDDSTRLEDITGAAGETIRTGTLVFNEVGGAGVFTVDLSTADTIGDVVTAINDAAAVAAAGVTATLADTGLVIAPSGSSVSVTDSSGGAVAADLGILTPTPATTDIVGGTLLPQVTRLTPIEDLAGGAGIDIDSGFIITNGGQSATVDISAAVAVQDIVNAINNAGVHVLARVNEAGTGIDVFNQVSGTSLTIGENGGTTAADLGIRTFDTATPLDQLNFGNGIITLANKADIRVTAKNGKNVDVDLDGAATVGDVITRINDAATAASVAITASLATTGNGIQIDDQTGGTGNLTVGILNLAQAAMDLGLNQTVSGTTTVLIGADVNPTRTEGIIGALIDLENALRGDDTQGITAAGGRLDTLRNELTRMHGIIGARAQTMQTRRLQIEDAAGTAEVFLSQVRDLDYAEAVTQLQAAMGQLQANLRTSSIVMNLSVLDFLQ